MARRRSKPSIISIVSGKGGVGKTTTALGLASYWAAQGHDTYLVDADPQDAGSATWWHDRTDGHPNLEVGKHTDLPTLSRLREVEGFDFVVVDTAPRPDSEQLAAICAASDLVVVMAGAGPLPLSAAVQTVTSLVRPTGATHVCLVTMIDPRRQTEASTAREELRRAGIPTLQQLARHYVVMERASSNGVLPADINGPNSTAALEDLAAIAREVEVLT